MVDEVIVALKGVGVGTADDMIDMFGQGVTLKHFAETSGLPDWMVTMFYQVVCYLFVKREQARMRKADFCWVSLTWNANFCWSDVTAERIPLCLNKCAFDEWSEQRFLGYVYFQYRAWASERLQRNNRRIYTAKADTPLKFNGILPPCPDQ